MAPRDPNYVRTLNIPDTVGYTTPDEFGGLIAGIDGAERRARA